MPIHPRTKKNLIKYNLFSKLRNKIKILDPQPYVELLKLINDSKYVITDSGGIQKEALLKEKVFYLEMKQNGKRKIGFNKIIPPISKKTFINCYFMKLMNVKVYHDTKLFGDGKSSEKNIKDN